MRLSNNKKALSSTMVAIIIIFVVFIVTLFFVPRTFWESLGVIDIVGGGIENRDAIRNKCMLACQDNDVDLFCGLDGKNKQTLNLGGGWVVKGSCYEISGLTIKNFKGVPLCRESGVNCLSEKIDPACFRDKKKVDCKEFE